ncbi:3-keto-L-gulonate-6-phosphate decarboxylase [Escherichia coli]|uniref:3-dehydro-L-gulonate-6-phosphate decarboxylase n=1 Tax=Escherichia coli TaxID=562 RepID=A0A376ZL27_ECOLX|nr:3-keto-L-gulonate-6-phosphate decarboxylase [Escherichia coli]
MSLPMLQVRWTTRLWIAPTKPLADCRRSRHYRSGYHSVRGRRRACGSRSESALPAQIVLADAKIADAGKILSRMCFEANADWVTVICCADINTAKGALDVAKEFNGDVQIELTGYWTWEQAQQWRDAGIQQVVYHRSRDAQAAGVAWGEADITAIKRLSDMGFKVTVTGGLALEDLPLFKGIPIHVFIAGRSIRDAASPVEAARQFKRSIAELWAKERICCPNKSRLASMKKRSRRGVLAGTPAMAKTLGFDFVEMSVDETDERLSRLDWSREQRLRW